MEQHAAVNQFNTQQSWTILSNIEQSIKTKVEEIGVPLKDWNISINRGILTGFNEAFIITGEKRKELISLDPKSAEIIRPILRGRDIKRYGYDFADLWLINTHNGVVNKGIPRVDVINYPAIKTHLDNYFPELQKRYDKGDTPYNLRSCDYMDDFYKQKIVYAETMRVHKKTDNDRFPRFSYSEEGIFLDKTCFMITGDKLLYILPILNSKSMCFFIRNNIAVLDTGGFLMQKIYIDRLPIPPVPGETRNKLETLCVQIFEERKRSLNSYNLEDEVDSIIYNLYGFTRDEITYIEKISSELRSMSR